MAAKSSGMRAGLLLVVGAVGLLGALVALGGGKGGTDQLPRMTDAEFERLIFDNRWPPRNTPAPSPQLMAYVGVKPGDQLTQTGWQVRGVAMERGALMVDVAKRPEASFDVMVAAKQAGRPGVNDEGDVSLYAVNFRPTNEALDGPEIVKVIAALAERITKGPPPAGLGPMPEVILPPGVAPN